MVLEDIRRWFDACGYVVSEQVGAHEGTVDRFATPRHGLMPPRTWLTIVPRFPDDLHAANDNLDLVRDEMGADRALAIVTEDVTPEGYHPDLNGGVANHVSARYLALHLAGVFDELSEMVEEPADAPCFSHRILMNSGEVMNACERIDSWIDQGMEDQLELEGGPFGAIAEIVREAARRRAKRFLARPDQVVPIVLGSSGAVRTNMLEMLLEHGWAVRANIPVLGEGTIALRRLAVPAGIPPMFSRRVEQIVEPTTDEAVAWFRSAAPEAPAEPLRSWLLRDAAALRLFQRPDLRTAILAAAREEPRSPGDDSWLARVLDGALEGVLKRTLGRMLPSPDSVVLVEEAALRDFALGQADLKAGFDRVGRSLDRAGLLLIDEPLKRRGEALRYKFASTCVRDWFLARKIARDVRSGNRDILARYVFPRVDVGLFLAVIAPDVAVLMGAGQAEEIRRVVETEVARRVELTLGHQLNRSIGSLGAHVRTVRRALRESDMDERTRAAFVRIDEELDHLRKLTERSRLLNESRQWEVASLPLLEVVAVVTDPLRERHAGVDVDITVSADLTVRAARDGLREVLHCLVENAFHSVCALPEERPRKIEIVARREGETVRMVLKDNGIGVRPEDRERIFEPFVTTKTGGSGRSRGTGLGLSIARTFAESMGARVTLESSNGETVFVVVLVTGD